MRCVAFALAIAAPLLIHTLSASAQVLPSNLVTTVEYCAVVPPGLMNASLPAAFIDAATSSGQICVTIEYPVFQYVESITNNIGLESATVYYYDDLMTVRLVAGDVELELGGTSAGRNAWAIAAGAGGGCPYRDLVAVADGVVQYAEEPNYSPAAIEVQLIVPEFRACGSDGECYAFIGLTSDPPLPAYQEQMNPGSDSCVPGPSELQLTIEGQYFWTATASGAGLMVYPSLAVSPIQWPVAVGGNGHWYEFVAAQDISWDDAVADAEGRSWMNAPGHLATLTTGEENAWVWDNFGLNRIWIGADQVEGATQPDEGWSWITGEAWEFTNWNLGEPNDYFGADQDALNLNPGGFWDDESRSAAGSPGFVVEYDLGRTSFVESGESYPGSTRSIAWTRLSVEGGYAAYLTRRSQPNVLLRNSLPDSIYEDTPLLLADPGNGMATLWLDFANDGRLDALILNTGEPNQFLFNVDGSSFISITGTILADESGSRTAEALDFDNDGDLDMFLTRTEGLPDLLVESGPTGFVDVTPPVLATPASTAASATADFDNDGDPDIYVVRWGSPNVLVRNDGGGVWTDVTPALLADPHQGNGAAWGDYDGDGLLDLAITNADAPNRIFHNDGRGQFSDATPAAFLTDSGNSSNPSWIDIDNDGWLDLFFTRGPSSDQLWRNTGSGFELMWTQTLSVPGNHSGAAWADVDHDGDMDVFQVEYEDTAPSKMLLNDLSNGNSWVEVDLVGVQSNRAGIGARVRVVSDGQSQIRDVICSAGNRSQNMITAHFGLGSATVIDSLFVRWPSGVEQVGTNLPVNELKTIWEGGSMTDAPSVPGVNQLTWLGVATPNPFNPSTTISYSTRVAGHVKLVVFDIRGRLVTTLLDGSVSAGPGQVIWRGVDASGSPVSSGVYLYRLTASDFEQTKRMVLVR